jgi:S-adenosylmethionine-dependent methyltransferase
MAQPHNPFTDSLERWKNEQATPWSQLKYRLVAANLALHLPPGPLQILDAGGGNGVEALAFAHAGHDVTLVDSSAAMLAEARSAAAALDLSGHLRAVELNLAALPERFPAPSFDLVLCHNVLQYVSDVGQLLDGLLAVLRPGGVLSLVSINRYSVPYQAAFLHRDLQRAYASLDDSIQRATIFDTPMTLYTAEEMTVLLAARGVAGIDHYGIRCLCDYWGDNAEKARPEVMAQLERLERRLTGREPYKQLARYFQLVTHRG